jgi:hypothetical protein
MNDKIYVLAEKAGAYCEHLLGGDYKRPLLGSMNMEMYAALIIAECIKACERTNNPDACVDSIRETFGVK